MYYVILHLTEREDDEEDERLGWEEGKKVSDEEGGGKKEGCGEARDSCLVFLPKARLWLSVVFFLPQKNKTTNTRGTCH